jgi:Fe-S cluster biogenesis protein NfuA
MLQTVQRNAGLEPDAAETRLMFIQTESTPNPATLKFLPGCTVLESGALEFRSREEASASPLAGALLSIAGVETVMFGHDFVSVTKTDADWAHLKPAILGTIMEHFSANAPLLGDEAKSAPTADGEFFDPADAQTVATIKELIETRVRPAVAGDGGDIVFRGFRDGVVYLRMKGACSGCPSSTATLKNGIENLLRHFVPEIRAVEQG